MSAGPDGQPTASGRPGDPWPGRRQVDELTAAELRASPAWWFPPEDGRLSGPDAGTVVPVDAAAADPTGACEFPEGRWLLHARFTFADGSAADGHVTWVAGETGDLSTQEPTLVTPGGPVPLWHGLLVPDGREVARLLALLGRPRGAVFPVRWRATLHPTSHEIAGEAAGFAVWRGGRVDFV